MNKLISIIYAISTLALSDRFAQTICEKKKKTLIWKLIMCKTSRNRTLSILAKHICYCVFRTCHLPRAHCHLQQEQQRQGTKKKKKKIQTFYIDVSSILFTYNENDLFFSKRSGQGRKKRGEMVCQAAEKRSLKCLELFTAEMPNQYWGSGAIGQLFNAGFLSSQSGWRRSIKSLSVCK